MLFLVASFSLFAQDKSVLTVSTTGAANLRVILNDRQYSLQDRTATFQNLEPGNYDIIIYQLQPQTNGTAAYTEVFNSSFQLKAGRHHEIAVLRFGKARFDEASIGADDWGDGAYVNPAYGNDYGNNTAGPVDNAQFEKMRNAINEGYYNDTKLTYAKAIMKNNRFTAEQVKTVCKLFTNDDTRMELVKFAWDLCVDKGNYFTITDAFYYNSSKETFMKFIGGK